MRRRPWNIIRRGALSNILNPKPVLFLPMFLPLGFTSPGLWPDLAADPGLGLIFTFTGTLVTMGYGIVAGYAGHMLGRRLGLMNRIAAVMFAGLRCALSRNELCLPAHRRAAAGDPCRSRGAGRGQTRGLCRFPAGARIAPTA